MRSIIAVPITAIAFLTGFLGPNLVYAHTAAYNQGFSKGEQDEKNGFVGNGLDKCTSLGFSGTDLNHCAVGYDDGVKSAGG